MVAVVWRECADCGKLTAKGERCAACELLAAETATNGEVEALRDRVRRRDHGGCFVCGHPASEVHFLDPDGGDADITNLVTLCEGHRATLHGRADPEHTRL